MFVSLSCVTDSVIEWRDRGGLDVWEAAVLAGGSAVLTLNVSHMAVGSMASSLQVLRATGEEIWPARATALIAVPKLKDDNLDDVAAYAKGMVLRSSTPRAHRRSQATGSTFTLHYGGGAFTVDAYTCGWSRYENEACETTNGRKNCRLDEVVTAQRRWLTEVQLVADGVAAGNGSALGQVELATDCAFKYHTKSQTWREPLNSATKGSRQEDLAQALCRDSAPPADVELNVVIRSSLDPYLAAGRLTSCSYDFGPSVAELRRTATLCGLVGGALAVPGVLVCAHFLVLRAIRRVCRGRDAPKASSAALPAQVATQSSGL